MKMVKPAEGFRSVWRRLSARGVVDAIDGAEYNRVWRQWLEANAPAEMEEYIRADKQRQLEIAAELARLAKEDRPNASA
jgi:hypothetical protein